ncbi:hypothetical protein Y032_0417g1096 [Ancylostoma ceylanicum]|uniref:Uncharacterized protein n=1 Tax=Ancylostoma ceylanicum TaxID=53326 RepID=A0A016X106_9BILA|nr:hypothetical protein Y032_0417g1096 [Ancylostoma ceylanicum]
MRYVPQLRCGGREGLERRQEEGGCRQYRDPVEIRDVESERTSGARLAPFLVGERILCNRRNMAPNLKGRV